MWRFSGVPPFPSCRRHCTDGRFFGQVQYGWGAGCGCVERLRSIGRLTSPCSRKLGLNNGRACFTYCSSPLVCVEPVGMISGLIVGLHGPLDNRAARQHIFILCRQILINLFDGLFLSRMHTDPTTHCPRPDAGSRASW